MTTPRLSPQAWTDLTALALLWAASFLAVRIALDEIGFLSVVAHRVFWAALALWVVVFWRGLPIPRIPRVWAALFGMGMLNNAIPFTLMAWGQMSIEVGLTVIFNAASAIFGVVIAAMVFADERLTGQRIAGVLLGFAGVVAAIGIENLIALDIRSLAQLAVLGGALSYAFAGAWGRAFLRGLAPEVAAAGMLTSAALVLVPLAIWIEGAPDLSLQGDTIAAIAYYALFGTALAYLLYFRILAVAGAGNLLLVTLMIPPVAIVLGALVRAETLEPRAFVGFGLLALGLLVMDGRVAHLLRRTTQRN